MTNRGTNVNYRVHVLLDEPGIHMNIPVRSEGGALTDLLFSHVSSFMYSLSMYPLSMCPLSLRNAVT